jgi:hypothetical protein
MKTMVRLTKILCSSPLLAILISVSTHQAEASQKFRFVGEDIYMRVLEDSVEVTGIYEFASTIDENRGWPIFYPYVMDKDHGDARTILVEVVEDDTSHPLQFKEREIGSTWHLDLPANSWKKVRVVYRQELKSNLATYVLTTTRAWHAPLDYANFYVTVPREKSQGVTLSYAPDDTTTNEDGSVTYVIRRSDLMPERDLTVKWLPPEPPERAQSAEPSDTE